MASEWWDPNGKFSPLHKFNPVRQEYLIDRISSHFSLSLDKNFSFSNLTLLVYWFVEEVCYVSLLPDWVHKLQELMLLKIILKWQKIHAQKNKLTNSIPQQASRRN